MDHIPRRVALVALILLLAGAVLACDYSLPFMGQFAPAPERQIVVVTVPVLITTTPGPVQVIVVTATPSPAQSTTTQATIAATTSAAEALATAQASLPSDCVPHVLAEGEFPSLIAEQYGVTLADLLTVNNLTEETSAFLEIGQVIIVPLEGCSLLSGTTALQPTAENAVVTIAAVRDAGSLSNELVEIRNRGTSVVDLTDWTLRDSQGETYTFPNFRLFGGGSITLFSRVGDDTAIALFWDRQQSAYTRGEVITLFDNQGRAQSTFTVP